MGSPLGFETPFSCRNIWAEYSCWTFNAMMFFATQITSQPYLPLPSVFYITCRTSQSFWLKNFKISEKSTNFFSKISEPKIGRNLPTNKEKKTVSNVMPLGQQTDEYFCFVYTIPMSLHKTHRFCFTKRYSRKQFRFLT